MTLDEMISYFKKRTGKFEFPSELEFGRHTSGERCFKCKYNGIEVWVPERFIKVYLLDFYPDNDNTFECMTAGKTFRYEPKCDMPGVRFNMIGLPILPKKIEDVKVDHKSDSEYVRMIEHYVRIEKQALEKDAEEDAYEHILVKIPKAGSIPDIDYYAFQCFLADFKGIVF